MLLNSILFASTLAVSAAFAAPAGPELIPAGNSTPSANFSLPDTLGTADPAMTTIDGILFSMDPPMITPTSISSVLASSSPVGTAAPLPPVLNDTITDVITATYIVTEAPVTVTLSVPPTTVTEIITVIPSPSPQPTSPPQTTWAAPAQMTDLSAFNVSAFPGGQRNLQIVDGIPAAASATSLASDALPTSRADLIAAALTSWDNSSSVLQLLYPANSINPGTKPQGGAEFYATPLAMQNANNVSLEYSIFFPLDYDWVLGGKLPGLYGGHTGCSGGNNALTCFSTRLMWRQQGMGELYLYAPKAKQTQALCSDPQSVCDATYGFSIGRGSFQYTPGGWTHVRQTVLLNTPGKQDGGFALDVNGKRVIDRSDVFYRDVFPPPKQPKPQPSGILGPLLGGLLKDALYPQNERVQDLLPPLLQPTTGHVPTPNDTDQSLAKRGAQTQYDAMTTTITATASPVFVTNSSTATATALLYVNTESVDGTPLSVESAPPSPQSQPVGFSGIFFSTFFGGHEAQYATPKDQHTWFKDFAMSCQP